MNQNRPRASRPVLNRRTFIKTGTTFSLPLLSGCSQSSHPVVDSPQPPNILVLLTDQQGINTISAAGCPYVDTPAMDRLVNTGIHFSESYSSNPVCSPARSVILTGRTSIETGVPSNGKRIREDIPNIGQWFEEHSDYETVYAGKWHLPNSRIRSIEGFNVISTGLGGPGFLGDTSVSSACEAFIRNRSSQTPFLMVASFLQPHDICEWLRINTFVPEDPRYPQLADELPPLPANFDYDKREPEYLQGQRERNEPNIGNWTEEHWRYYLWSYYRHIEMVDAEIGRIIDALEESGQRKNTLVLLISDHGEGLAGQQTVRKSNPYDGASKVPFVVSWPGSVASGQPDSRHLVSHLDIVPTLCDYGGINTPSNMRGHSLRRILEGESVDTHDFVVTEMPGDRARLARTKQFKFVSYAGDPVELFFDRVKDPEETTNVASDPAYTSDIEDHRKLVRDWERHLEPFPKTVNREAWWR